MIVNRFIEMPVAPRLMRDHASMGGRDLRAFARQDDTGVTCVMLATEPMRFDPPRDYERHLSVSCLNLDDDGKQPVTDAHAKLALDTFFGRLKWKEEGSAPFLRHFWAPLPSWYASAKPGAVLPGKFPFRVTECIDGHAWGRLEDSLIEGEHCRICGTMRRRDRNNWPCRGSVAIGPRSEPKGE